MEQFDICLGKTDDLGCEANLYADTEHGLQQHLDLLARFSSHFQRQILHSGPRSWEK